MQRVTPVRNDAAAAPGYAIGFVAGSTPRTFLRARFMHVRADLCIVRSARDTRPSLSRFAVTNGNFLEENDTLNTL